ncbi:hypothetical protein H4219_003756 [Mycoemilia scoparia]|uniref:Uncharacterized protein n=1 Tax=Mycoemilia scoparia TaxID=417184 RepID=A0A9W7ZTU1_9FUNG|nr:hypothetical protein H4219_003756 [Mycoemilia scoparia]
MSSLPPDLQDRCHKFKDPYLLLEAIEKGHEPKNHDIYNAIDKLFVQDPPNLDNIMKFADSILKLRNKLADHNNPVEKIVIAILTNNLPQCLSLLNADIRESKIGLATAVTRIK